MQSTQRDVAAQGQDLMRQAAEAVSGAAVAATEKVASGDALPSNADVARSLETVKPGTDIPLEKLTPTGQEMAAQVEKLVNDTQRIFLTKNREEDLQKAAFHASRAAQIARRHDLVTTAEGQEAMEAMRKGTASAVNLAKLIVTSSEFRDELAEALGVVQQALMQRSEKMQKKLQQQDPHKLTQEPNKTFQETKEEWDEDEDEDEETPAQESGITGGAGQPSWTEKAKQYQPLSEEQQDELADRFYRLVHRLQEKPEYQGGIRFVLEQLRTAVSKGNIHADRVQQQLQETEEGRLFQEESSRAKDHALRLIENWTETSVDPLYGRINVLRKKMANDQETRDELNGLVQFVEGLLTGDHFRDDKESIKREIKGRFSRTRHRLLEHYDEPSRGLLEELSYLRDSFMENQASEVLRRDVNDLINTVLYDDQGQPTVKLELLKDVQIMLSSLMRKVQFIPVPRVAVTTKDIDFVGENIVLNLRELTPKQIHFESLTKIHDPDLEKGKPKTEHTEPIQMQTFLRLHLTGIIADIKNFIWYYNKKTGMVQEHDRGRADLKIYGRGMSIDIDLMPTLPVPTADKPVARSIEILQTKVRVHKMALRIYDSKHDWMYAIFKPFLKSQLKKAVESSVEQYMSDYLQQVDKTLTESAVGEYPATRPVEVGRKDMGTFATSTTGQPQEVRTMSQAPTAE